MHPNEFRLTMTAFGVCYLFQSSTLFLYSILYSFHLLPIHSSLHLLLPLLYSSLLPLLHLETLNYLYSLYSLHTIYRFKTTALNGDGVDGVLYDTSGYGDLVNNQVRIDVKWCVVVVTVDVVVYVCVGMYIYIWYVVCFMIHQDMATSSSTRWEIMCCYWYYWCYCYYCCV